jgi:hypothetical protein
MKMRSLVLAAGAVLGPASFAAAADMPVKAVPEVALAPFFLVSDTTVGVHWDPQATDPGVGVTAKTVLEITHFDAWQYGTNFVNLDWLYSDRRDPAQCDGFAFPTQPSCLGTQGAMEFYGLYRGTLGGNQLTHSTAFTFGPIKNIALSFGGDWNTENNPFAPEKKDIVGGLQFQFAVPTGFFNMAVHAYTEWNHNGLPGTLVSNVNFKTVPEVEFTYMQPLTFTGLPLRISGFTNVVAPKGPDGFGNATRTELLSDNRLVLDIGKLVANKENWWDVYVGYRYWRNKFGNDDALLPFAKEETIYVGVAWHALTDNPPPKSSSNMPLKAPAPAWTPFFFVSDTSVGVHWDPRATDPGVSVTAKTVLEITHFDAWALGTNFVNLDWLYSDRRDPAQCDAFFAQPSCAGTQGAMEFYGVYRGTFSFNALSHSKAFTFGPVKDLSFSFGGDWNTENNAFAPEKKDVVAGLKVNFDVPGFLGIAVHAYKEWNHNALPGTIISNVEFNTVPEIEVTYMQPLNFTGLPLKFTGFTNVVTPKGRDGFGNQTVTEVLSDNRLVLDLGKVVANRANLWDAYVGYRYWRNKFGNDDTILPFAKEETVYVGVAWHAL